jgi:hypothetical protein
VSAPAAARSEQRYICANDMNVERAPVNGPIGVAFRGDRFVATRFARHGTWARGTAFGFALERRPVKRAVGWVRVSDLCARGTVPWSALPPSGAPSGFLGARLAAGPPGVVYLADAGEVVWLSVRTAPSGRLALRSRPLGHLRATALTTGPDGRLYVGTSDATIAVYSPAGKLVRTFGHRGNGTGELHQVLSLAVTGSGEVYASDVVNHITRFTAGGAVLGQWSGLKTPLSLTVDRDGDVDVLEIPDARTERIRRFSADGHALAQFDVPGGSANQLAVGPDGNLVVSSSDGRIRVMSTDGQIVRELADRPATGGGSTVTVGPAGTVYLLTDRLVAFGPDGGVLGASSVGQRYSG